MNLKLSELDRTVVIKCNTVEQWNTCQNIFTLSGYKNGDVDSGHEDTFEDYPAISVEPFKKEYVNIQGSIAEHYYLYPASDFITANTPHTPEPWHLPDNLKGLCNETTNLNNPTTEGANI